MARHCVAGVYAWAAESVFNIEGDSALYRRYCQQAAALDHYVVEARILLRRTREQLHNKQLELRQALEWFHQFESKVQQQAEELEQARHATAVLQKTKAMRSCEPRGSA